MGSVGTAGGAAAVRALLVDGCCCKLAAAELAAAEVGVSEGGGMAVASHRAYSCGVWSG